MTGLLFDTTYLYLQEAITVIMSLFAFAIFAMMIYEWFRYRP